MTALDNKTRAGTRDGYGFVVPTPYVSLFRENSRVYEVEEAHRTKSWGTWTAAYGGCLTTALEAARMARMESNRAGAGDASTSGSSRVPYHELGVLVKTVGVPKEMRRQVWLSCLVDKGMFGEGELAIGRRACRSMYVWSGRWRVLPLRMIFSRLRRTCIARFRTMR